MIFGIKSLLWFPFLILFATTSCENKNDSPAQILHLNISDDPISLDPGVVRSLKDLTIVKQMYEGLVRLDQNGIPQLAIAEKVEISQDLLTYTFYLREAYWNNGDPVTAYDFEYAWKKVLDPSFASDYSYILYPIENAQSAREGKCEVDEIGIVALDDQKLLVQLHSPIPYFLELLAFPTYFPINHLTPEECSICNGPFFLKRWIPQNEIVLEKNPAYWDNQSVLLDQICFSVIDDNNTESYLFQKKELDWLGQPISNAIGMEMLSKIRVDGNLNSYGVAGTFWFKFNTEKEPFDHPKVRRAFAYALNRQEIITHILQGGQIPATGPLPPSLAPHQDPYFQDGDIEKSKLLLEEVCAERGWSLQTFPSVVLHYPPTVRNMKIVQLVQQQWQRALGIPITLAAVEDQLYRRNVRQGLYQVGTGDWIADFNDPVAFLELFKGKNDSVTGNGMNDTGWENKQYISLLDQSLIERDPQKRGQLLHDAEKILVEEMPIAPVYHFSFNYVKNPNVQGVLLSPLGIADFKTAYIEHYTKYRK